MSAPKAATARSRWTRSPDCRAVNTSTPMMAPMGSMVVLSQPRMLVSRRPGRAIWRSGPTTVGPETMTMAPNMAAALPDRPSRPQANRPAPAQVSGMPQYKSRRTTRWLCPSSWANSSSRPPSNRMTAMPRVTRGVKAEPRKVRAFTVWVIVPATKPTGSRSTMAGSRSRPATT